MSYEPDSIVGKTAHVTVAIPGDSKPGEVVIRIRGGAEYYIAYSDQPTETGAEVLVVADRGARSLSVTPL